MKMLRTKEQVENLEKKKQKALEGCDVCPCCKMDAWVNFQKHSYLALTFKGFVEKERRYYKCRRCGVMWRSGSYVIEDKYGDI